MRLDLEEVRKELAESKAWGIAVEESRQGGREAGRLGEELEEARGKGAGNSNSHGARPVC